MSKAPRLPRELSLRTVGSPFITTVFPVIEHGKVMMRIDNAGPFNKRESLRLAQWIRAAFNEPTA